MTIKEYLKTHNYSDLFDTSKYNYPAPFDTAAFQVMITQNLKIHFGGLKMREDCAEDKDELQLSIYTIIMDNDETIKAVNKIMSFLSLTPDDPSRTIVREYGEKERTDVFGETELTTDYGERSTTDNLGATHGTSQNTGTSYASATGKNTTGTEDNTDAVENSTTTDAVTDTQSTIEHTDTHTDATYTDTESIYNNVSEDNAADIILKYYKVARLPIMRALERILVDAIALPYYE